MMFAPSTSSATTSAPGRTSAAAAGAADRRVRVVRLLRPKRSPPAFGFSLRGGHEHTTGFFISKVEFNSEAQHQGLKVGDQLVSVNGFRVEDAIHSELAHFLASQSRLKLKVRNVGMIPVKEKPHEALSWHFVNDRTSLSSGASSSPTLCHDKERMSDVCISILVPPRAKLGCGICKGPEWKPGIFVQFVREGGIAQEAGLRPGDQILACNGHTFANIHFNDAIAVMKNSGILEVVVREGAGLELVSPESSGYNSSASSAAGERSPGRQPPAPPPPALAPPAPAALRRRLASVAEDVAADRVDRYAHIHRPKRRTWDTVDHWRNSDIHNFDVPSDIEPDYDSPSIPNNPHSYDKLTNQRRKEFTTAPSNRTIINLTEDGATIQCTYEAPSKKLPPSQLTPFKGCEKDKMIVVEVHHRDKPAVGSESHVNRPLPATAGELDSESSASSVSLSCAIAEEIQRRKMNKKNSESTNQEPVKRTNVPKTIDNSQLRQHDALIDEFKKVHSKMFANQKAVSNDSDDINGKSDTDRQPTYPLRKLDDVAPIQENGHSTNAATNGNVVINKVTNGHTINGSVGKGHVTNGHIGNGHVANFNGQGTNGYTANGHVANGHVSSNAFNNDTKLSNNRPVVNGNGNTQPKREPSKQPPPPPPMPTENGFNGNLKKMISHMQEKLNMDIVNGAASVQLRNGTLPRTPTPDYNVKSGTMRPKTQQIDENPEQQSIESYTLRNPQQNTPKPPTNYFSCPPNGTATMKKSVRPVSVTIGEYNGSNGSRRPPTKLDFLHGDCPDGLLDEGDADTPLSNRLHSELAQTLSRSNLRNKTETLDSNKNLKNNRLNHPTMDVYFHKRYGNNILPVAPSISIPKVSTHKHSVRSIAGGEADEYIPLHNQNNKMYITHS